MDLGCLSLCQGVLETTKQIGLFYKECQFHEDNMNIKQVVQNLHESLS